MTINSDQQPVTPKPTEEAAVDSTKLENGESAQAPAIEESQAPDITLAGEAMNLLSEHKGKLAIGVAATLGMMVYYGWRENRLAKTDPEEYARLQRLKAMVRHSDDQPKSRASRKAAARSQAGQQTTPAIPETPAPDAAPDIS
jgi:hypothetical protein